MTRALAGFFQADRRSSHIEKVVWIPVLETCRVEHLLFRCFEESFFARKPIGGGL
jgi:hypothetical protein